MSPAFTSFRSGLSKFQPNARAEGKAREGIHSWIGYAGKRQESKQRIITAGPGYPHFPVGDSFFLCSRSRWHVFFSLFTWLIPF